MSQTLKLYIPKVLSENKIVLLKGIGTLRMNYRPAEVDVESGTLVAPREEVYFVPSSEEKLDPVLVRIVEIIARVDQDEAEELVEKFMIDLQTELQEDGFVTLPSIGWIKQDHWGSLFFEPAAEYISINKYFGFGKVELPEALSVAEQEAIADLKETAGEKTERDALVTLGNRSRAWGFIISGGLLIILLLSLSFLHSDWSDRFDPVINDQEVWAETIFTSSSRSSLIDHQANEVNSNQIDTIDDSQMKVAGPILEDQDHTQTSECIVVVGAFTDLTNVDRMVDRIDDSHFDAVVINGPRLTKVGLRSHCEDPSKALAWAQANIDPDAWIYRND